MDSLRSPVDGRNSAAREDEDNEIVSEDDDVQIKDVTEDGDYWQAEEDSKPNHRALMDLFDKTKSRKLNWQQPGIPWQTFWTANKEDVKKLSEFDGKNFLHILVEAFVKETSARTKQNLGHAIGKVTSRYPDLVKQLDNAGQTPLYRAMVGGKPKLVDLIVSLCVSKSGSKRPKKDDPLTNALAVKCRADGRFETALHYALREPQCVESADTLMDMVGKASEETVSATDSNGFTPLHYAVDYRESSDHQYEIIKTLLKKGDTMHLIASKTAVLDQYGVIDKEAGKDKRSTKDKSATKDKNAIKEEFSVYQYHIKTRQTFVEKVITPKSSVSSKQLAPISRKEQEERERARQGQPPQDERKRESGKQDERRREPAKQEKEGIGGERPGQARREERDSKVKDGPGALRKEAATRDRGRDEAEPQEAETRQKKPRNTLEEPKSQSTRTVTFQEQPEEKEETPEERKRKRDFWSEKIKAELKTQFLRTRTHEKATRFLYGKNPQDIQICFEYQGLSATADADSFPDSFNNVKFDSVLKYVAFTSVKVENWRDGSINSDATGRSDMLFFFNWLREQKKVEKILKVIVDDSVDPPHSDEAIEKALSGFDVEILDWSKPDLDPDMLFRISKELREVHLHWSGNNTVLRAWSDPDGLRKLPKLETVHLHVDKTLESRERTQMNIDKFEERLKEPLPSASDRPMTLPQRVGTGLVVEPMAQDDKPKPVSIEGASSPAFRPITVMGGLDSYGQRRTNAAGPAAGATRALTLPSHKWLECVDMFGERIRNVWKKILTEKRDDPPPEVIIALIDDGVDNTHLPLISKLLTGRTFGFDQEGERIRPWYVSEKGHGTVMATMMLRVCPMVKIYPIRLNTDHKGNIKQESAALAIEAAVDRGADIISMSWTVSPPVGEAKKALDRALELAIENDVLMFCSSNDKGHYTDKHYPSYYRPEAVFKIGAASPAGLPYDLAGALEGLDFIFPGVEVVQNHANAPLDLDKCISETGSSIATALGAGLAALIIYCARIGQMYGKFTFGEEDVRKLRKHEVMRKAITAFGTSQSKGSQGKFVEVWQKLDTKTKELSRLSSQQRARDLIADLARDLVTRA